jgi:hypothetical protein
MARKQANWFGMGMDAWQLGLDAAQVMWLRTSMIALGGAKAELEAVRMVEEKVAANADFAWLLATGAAGTTPASATRRALRHYGPRVRANRKRLTARR